MKRLKKDVPRALPISLKFVSQFRFNFYFNAGVFDDELNLSLKAKKKLVSNGRAEHILDIKERRWGAIAAS